MPAHRATDPLVSLSVRIPQSLRDALNARVNETGVTLADQIRARLDFNEVKPLGVPVRRRRAVGTLDRVQSADPALLRGLAAIGSNLNQVARAVNTGAVTGDLMQAVDVLVVLRAIELEFAALIADNRRASNAR